MSDNPRDTQFQGFAELLWIENAELIMDAGNATPFDAFEQIVNHLKLNFAQRAYDLVEHTLLSLDIDTTRALISDVPDLKQWLE